MDDLIERAAKGLLNSHYAIALTGAGMSTESGIPDFRGPDGIWTKNPNAERNAYEAYDNFLRDPKAHWEEILTPGSFFGLFEDIAKSSPNSGHYALAELEKIGILKLVITQNIDGLHQKAGNQNIIEYHGGLAKLRCTSCGLRFDREKFNLEELKNASQLPPRCQECKGILKPDGVYFTEPIPGDVYRQSLEAALKCDLMLICGTSAVIYPFAQLPRVAREHKFNRERKSEFGLYPEEAASAMTIIEVNAEPTPLTDENISDYLIQGRTAQVLPRLVEEVKKPKKG